MKTKAELAEDYYKNLVATTSLPGPSSLCENSFMAGFDAALELALDKVRTSYGYTQQFRKLKKFMDQKRETKTA